MGVQTIMHGIIVLAAALLPMLFLFACWLILKWNGFVLLRLAAEQERVREQRARLNRFVL